MKEETKKTISLVLDVIISYSVGYGIGLIGGLGILLEVPYFGRRLLSTILVLVMVFALIFLNIGNFIKNRRTRYGVLMGTIFTGVLVPLFGQFYSETSFMFGYSFMQVALTAAYQILAWISYWYHAKIFDIKMTNAGLEKWMFVVLFVLINSNLVGLVKILIGSITNIIYGVI